VKSPISDEQVLLHLLHSQTVPMVLMTCCLRAACFLSSSTTRNSSNDMMADCHTHAHTPMIGVDRFLLLDGKNWFFPQKNNHSGKNRYLEPVWDIAVK